MLVYINFELYVRLYVVDCCSRRQQLVFLACPKIISDKSGVQAWDGLVREKKHTKHLCSARFI